MELATFDTLTAAAALRKAGIEEAHAAAIVQTVRSAVTEGVSTKADIAEVKAEITEVRAEITEVRSEIAEVRSEVAQLRAETKADIAELRAETKADIGEVKADVAQLKGDMSALSSRVTAIQWVIGIQFALSLAMAAKLFGIVGGAGP